MSLSRTETAAETLDRVEIIMVTDDTRKGLKNREIQRIVAVRGSGTV